MLTHREIFYLFGRMLSREVSSPGLANEPGKLPQSEAEWQKWVTFGSNHYILPAVFVRLSHNDAVRDYFPPELLQTLQSIYELNLKRNLNNMEQITFLRNLFDREGIPHLFMKGSGHITDELYTSPGERMMLDIDLLVHPEHFLKAAALCLDNGYMQPREFNKKGLLSARHYAMLVKEGFACSLEIHQMPVDFWQIKHFNTALAFKDSILTHGAYPGFRVMSDQHKAIHNFIHSQLMHHGHFTGHFPIRDAYDLYLLNKRTDIPAAFLELDKWKSKSIPYYVLMQKLFDSPVPDSVKSFSFYDNLIKRHDKYLALPPKKRRLRLFLFLFRDKYILLPIYALGNKYARNYIFSRIFSKAWYQLRLKLFFGRN